MDARRKLRAGGPRGEGNEAAPFSAARGATSAPYGQAAWARSHGDEVRGLLAAVALLELSPLLLARAGQ